MFFKVNNDIEINYSLNYSNLNLCFALELYFYKDKLNKLIHKWISKINAYSIKTSICLYWCCYSRHQLI